LKSQIKKLPKRKRPIQKLKKQRYLQKKRDKEFDAGDTYIAPSAA